MNKTITIKELTTLVNGECNSANIETKIAGFSPIESAKENEVTFLVKLPKKAEWELLQHCRAGAVFIPQKSAKEIIENALFSPSTILIAVRDPYLAAAISHNYFLAVPFQPEGIHKRAFIGNNCTLSEEITVKPLAVIGDNVKLGKRVKIESGAVIGNNVIIGDDVRICANVTLYDNTIIGNRVTIHSGTVIGSDGYGYAANEKGEHIKRPQIGIVRIEDDVEIGANCTVDCAAYGETVIGAGSKIDNLVQIGHNVEVGKNCLLVAQVGIAGSTKLGRNVALGGQAAVAGHISIGERTMAAARSGIHNSLGADEIVGGAPAIPVKQWAKCSAIYNKLPELQKKVRENKKTLDALINKGDTNEKE